MCIRRGFVNSAARTRQIAPGAHPPRRARVFAVSHCVRFRGGENAGWPRAPGEVRYLKQDPPVVGDAVDETLRHFEVGQSGQVGRPAGKLTAAYFERQRVLWAEPL